MRVVECTSLPYYPKAILSKLLGFWVEKAIVKKLLGFWLEKAVFISLTLLR